MWLMIVMIAENSTLLSQEYIYIFFIVIIFHNNIIIHIYCLFDQIITAFMIIRHFFLKTKIQTFQTFYQ